jgi:transcriptional regulator with XRE-family HTH domain
MELLNYADIAERLKAYRDSKGFSSRKFALGAGIDVSNYAKAEADSARLTENMLTSILTAYPEISKEYLLFGSQNETASLKSEESQHTSTPARSGTNAVDIADKILKFLPPLKPEVMTPVTQIEIYKEREEKLFMALDVLKLGLAALAQNPQKGIEENENPANGNV